jgi:hypothetical protein
VQWRLLAAKLQVGIARRLRLTLRRVKTLL